MNGGLLGRLSRTLALLFTAAVKLIGLASAFNQLLLQRDAHALPLAISAFMIAGAQFSEGLILSFLERLMAPPPPGKREP